MNFEAITQNAVNVITQVGLKVLGAIIIWFVGRALIRFAANLVGRGLARQNVDSTITSYIRTSLGVLLTLALVVALLGFFGVETTTFAALLAARHCYRCGLERVARELCRWCVPGDPAAVQGG